MSCNLFGREHEMAKRLIFVCFVVGLVFFAMSGCNNQSGIKVAQGLKAVNSFYVSTVGRMNLILIIQAMFGCPTNISKKAKFGASLTA
jgi:hypothetical protein